MPAEAEEASIFNQQEKERAKEETLDAIFTTRDLFLLERVQELWPSQDCTDNVLAQRGKYTYANAKKPADLFTKISCLFRKKYLLVS